MHNENFNTIYLLYLINFPKYHMNVKYFGCNRFINLVTTQCVSWRGNAYLERECVIEVLLIAKAFQKAFLMAHQGIDMWLLG